MKKFRLFSKIFSGLIKKVFMDDSIKSIMITIDGVDNYKLIPYLMEDEEFKNVVNKQSKIFIDF